MRPIPRLRWAALLLLLSILPASATFHFMKVVELFPGTAASPSAQYVVIQMYAPGQNLVAGHEITVFNAAGALVATFTFPGNVANGANQARILIATTEAQAFFGIAADLQMTAALAEAGGKACFASNIDCVAWGNYAGSATNVGTPFNAAGGLRAGQAMGRRLDIAGAADALDAGDDTNDSANDFVFRLPAPRNNAGLAGTIPGSTCGNGAIEGLEQCDDGNLLNGDGCSSTCVVDLVVAPPPRNDVNGDGASDVLWRNASTGANVAWRSAMASTPQGMASANLSWKAVGAGDFNADGDGDLAWRNGASGANTIWLSANAATPQATTGVTNQDWEIVAIADFDGDGKSDFLWRNRSSGANVIWRSGRSATPQAVRGVTNLAWSVVGAGDVNADRKADIVWRNAASGANVIWLSANANTPQAMTGVTNQDWKVVGVDDFDGDGEADLLWRNAASGANVIWRSGIATTSQAMAAAAVAWIVAATGDYDADGRADIAWRNTGTGANVIWRSANAATPRAMTGVTNQAWKVIP